MIRHLLQAKRNLHPIAFVTFLLLILAPARSAAQRDTLRLRAINDTLAINTFGDTLSTGSLHDTTLVIIERWIPARDDSSESIQPAIPLSRESDASGNRKFLSRVFKASRSVLRRTSVAVGLNVGATAPLKLPDNSSILSYAPLFAPSIALEKKFIIHRRLYALAGLRFEYKGMKARAAVKNFHTEVPQRMDDQILIFAGAFTGENVTRVVGSYISIPIRIGVQITKGYSLEAGGFVALAITRIFSGKVENGYLWTHPTDSEPVSSKIPIASADYSFSDNISRMDAGVELYGSHSLGANLLLNVGLGVGLIPLFDTHHFKGIPFAMYNIYLNMALGYRFE